MCQNLFLFQAVQCVTSLGLQKHFSIDQVSFSVSHLPDDVHDSQNWLSDIILGECLSVASVGVSTEHKNMSTGKQVLEWYSSIKCLIYSGL